RPRAYRPGPDLQDDRRVLRALGRPERGRRTPARPDDRRRLPPAAPYRPRTGARRGQIGRMGVSLYGIEKRFDDGTQAVRNLDLEIQDAEFFTLLGPSGCGKTTTL